MGKAKDFIARCIKEEKTPREIEREDKNLSGLGVSNGQSKFAEVIESLRNRIRGTLEERR